MNNKTTEWGWYQPDRSAHGPFPTREAAITDAQKYLQESMALPCNVVVGQIRHVRAEDWVQMDIDDLLERADNHLADNIAVDDYVFVVPEDKLEAAQEELSAFMKAWAKRWITCEMNWYIPGGDDVVIADDVPLAL
jgi:hypothetical protein